MDWKLVLLPIILLGVYFLLRYARNTAPNRDEVLVGLTDGQLHPCPDTPNCVSSYEPPADEDHHVDPLPYSTSRDEAREALLAIIGEMSRTEIVTSGEDYIWAEFRTRTIRFIDDVEFHLPEGAGVVHYRSASRAGQGDLGVNRRRYEEIAEAFRERMGR